MDKIPKIDATLDTSVKNLQNGQIRRRAELNAHFQTTKNNQINTIKHTLNGFDV